MEEQWRFTEATKDGWDQVVRCTDPACLGGWRPTRWIGVRGPQNVSSPASLCRSKGLVSTRW